MSALEALRNAHARAIAEDPVEIVLHRVEVVDDGAGGNAKQEIDLPPFTGRLVPSRTQPRVVVSEAGRASTFDWMLLAPHDADVRVGDTFTVNGRTFRVARVIDRRLGGEPFAVQAYLEEVK